MTTEQMKKIISITLFIFLFTGCNGVDNEEEKKEYDNFIKKYGDEQVRICENGFLTVHYFFAHSMNKPVSYMMSEGKGETFKYIRCEEK